MSARACMFGYVLVVLSCGGGAGPAEAPTGAPACHAERLTHFVHRACGVEVAAALPSLTGATCEAALTRLSEPRPDACEACADAYIDCATLHGDGHALCEEKRCPEGCDTPCDILARAVYAEQTRATPVEPSPAKPKPQAIGPTSCTKLESPSTACDVVVSNVVDFCARSWEAFTPEVATEVTRCLQASSGAPSICRPKQPERCLDKALPTREAPFTMEACEPPPCAAGLKPSLWNEACTIAVRAMKEARKDDMLSCLRARCDRDACLQVVLYEHGA